VSRAALPAAVVWGTACAAACGPIEKREVIGPPGAVEPAAPPGRLVSAERFAPGSHLVFVDERGQRIADLTDPPNGPSLDLHPAFSPDGRWVAFASNRGGTRSSLWIVPADRSRPPARLTEGASDAEPAFSPDGRRLAFVSDRGGGLDLWTVEMSDDRPGALARVTDDPADEMSPAWSSRGDRIAYAAVARGGKEIRLVSVPPDGRGPQRLTDGSDPAFAPGDRFLAFVARGESADTDLWAIDLDGSHRRLLVRDELADEAEPRFSTDGRYLFANAILRRDDGEPLFSAVVFLDLSQPAAPLRALVDRLPAARVGIAVAPGPLDSDALATAPSLYDAMLRVLLR
jgi:Tol biopolymer transport system component